MKSQLFFACFLLLFTACRNNNTIFEGTPPDPAQIECFRTKPLVAPASLQMTLLDTASFNGSFTAFQMLNRDTGFALGCSNVGSFAMAFKTVNGGKNWQNLNINPNEHGECLHFLNEKIGFISLFSRPNAQILKTTDGGTTWKLIRYSNLNGSLYDITSDADGVLFAKIFEVTSSNNVVQSNSRLVKSSDMGETWQTLSVVGQPTISFSFQIFKNHLFLLKDNAEIVKMDKNGQILKTTKINKPLVNGHRELHVSSEDTLFINAWEGAFKTFDGGNTWEFLKNDDNLIDFAGFRTTQEGLIIHNKQYCKSDVYWANDVFAFTQDGGKTWDESPLITNLSRDFSDAQIVDNQYFIMLYKQFLVFKKK